MPTLEQQLNELRTNILRDRSDIIAGDTDSLWTDETLIHYIEDAELKFARETLLLRDSTSPDICTVTLKTGQRLYPLDKCVLAVISARFHHNDTDLIRSGHSLIFQRANNEFGAFDPFRPYRNPPGFPLAYYTDETMVFATKSRVSLAVFPEPSPTEDGKQLHLRVTRLPRTGYSKSCLDRESEIPHAYWLDVLEWAAYRAQRTFDGDAGAPTSADAHAKAFSDAVQQCLLDKKREMFATTNYRYGQNGFAWVR